MTIPKFLVSGRDRPTRFALISSVFVAGAFWSTMFLLAESRGEGRRFSVGIHRPGSGESGVARAADPEDTDVALTLGTEPIDVDLAFAKAYFGLIPVLGVLDRNRDLRLSDLEITSAPERLATLDGDGDNSLSAEECGAHFHDEAVAADIADLTRSLMAFDKNQDGLLERRELPARWKSVFDRSGTANPTGMTAADIARLAARTPHPERTDPTIIARGRMRFMDFHPILAALDRDRNGTISGVELAGAAASLRAMDRNRDGWINRSELLPGQLERKLARTLALDRNIDGRITQKERDNPLGVELDEVLNYADRDHDGVVTEQELVLEFRRRTVENR